MVSFSFLSPFCYIVYMNTLMIKDLHLAVKEKEILLRLNKNLYFKKTVK